MPSSEDFPVPNMSHLVRRIDDFPARTRPRRWVLRDDNKQHYHGTVRLSEGSVYMELRWKRSREGPEQKVGRYRLHLSELLAGDYVRFENENEPGDEVRLRFFRHDNGEILVQARADRPGLPVGKVRPRGR